MLKKGADISQAPFSCSIFVVIPDSVQGSFPSVTPTPFGDLFPSVTPTLFGGLIHKKRCLSTQASFFCQKLSISRDSFAGQNRYKIYSHVWINSFYSTDSNGFRRNDRWQKEVVRTRIAEATLIQNDSVTSAVAKSQNIR